MSFCEEQKNEILTSQYKSLCCRRSLLCGVLAAKAVLDGGEVKIRMSDKNARRFLADLISEIFSKTPEELSDPSGGRGKILSFKSNSAVKYVLEIKNSSGLMYNPKCGACRSAFLRGVFLSAGRVSEPERQYSLEFSFSEASAERFVSFFEELEIHVKIAKRGKEKIVYVKDSTHIEDFFGLAAMNTTAFSIMNSKIKSELRNDANRIANCEMNNIDKAVNTAMRQIAVISALESAGLLGSLPDELALTARLRLEYNSLSLAQLAGKFTPSISKPGLSHRLKKIEEIGKRLLANVKE